jgi:hypothetical protein
MNYALDTETQDGRAICYTLAHTSGANLFNPVASWGDLFPALCALIEGDGCGAYNMDYDARALISYLPRPVLAKIRRDEFADYRGWRISYRPGKWLRVSRGEGERFSLYDIWCYWQCSLSAAAKKAGVETQKQTIPQSWYANMARVFASPRTRARAIAYAQADARAALEVWRTVHRAYTAIGVPEKTLDAPVSPGAMAKHVFSDLLTGLPSGWCVAPAYFGGRVETFKRGRFHLYSYDIKSAYPAALATLPDPCGGHIVHDACERADALYSVYNVEVDIPPTLSIPLLPLRLSKTRPLVYPTGKFTTWITGPEYAECYRRGWIVDVMDGWHLVGCKGGAWMGDRIRRLYRERRDPAKSIAIKLVLNSLYGIMAQESSGWESSPFVERGSKWMGDGFFTQTKHGGPVRCEWVAAYITALTRLRIWRAMMGAPDAIAVAATDGILSTRPLDIASDPAGLGDWSYEGATDAVVIGCGILATPAKGHKERTRGLRLDGRLWDRIKTAGRSVLTCRVKHAVGLAEYLDARDGGALNEMLHINRRLDFNCAMDKRDWPAEIRHGRDLMRVKQNSRPYHYVAGALCPSPIGG